MIKLTELQITKLKESKICFHYADQGQAWIDQGIVKMPGANVFAEDYASYFMPTEFYTIGAFSYAWSHFREWVSVGRFCSIAAGVEVMPFAHPTDVFTTSSMLYDPLLLHRKRFYEDSGYENVDVVAREHPTNNKDIVIGNDVYIATGARLRRGITIGDGAIIGAYAVVTKDVPPYSVVVGNPGRVVKKRYTDEQIARLLVNPWWNYDFRDVLNRTHVDDIEVFLDRLERLIEAGDIRTFEPKRNNLAELLA